MKTTLYFIHLTVLQSYNLMVFILLVLTIPTLNAQTNYNPWQHIREQRIQIGLNPMPEYLSENCDTAKNAIKDYMEIRKLMSDDSTTYGDIYLSLRYLSFFQCSESYEFIKNLILTDTSEKIRCDAIRLLGWMRSVESITFLKRLLKKEKLSTKEKYHIISAFCLIAVYNEWQDIIDEFVILLDEFCGFQNGMVRDCSDENCSELYFMIGGETALNYFSYCFDTEELKVEAALKLTQLGEYETTFPIFADAINSGDTDNMFIAMQGLATIGTEEALQLIREQAQNEKEIVAVMANWILKYMNEKKGDKL